MEPSWFSCLLGVGLPCCCFVCWILSCLIPSEGLAGGVLILLLELLMLHPLFSRGEVQTWDVSGVAVGGNLKSQASRQYLIWIHEGTSETATATWMTVQCTLLQVRLSWCGMQALSVGKHMFRSFNRRLRLWCWFKSHALAFCVGHSMTRPSARHSQRSMRNWAMQGQSLMSWIDTFWVPCKQFPHVSKTSSLQTRLACIRSRISIQ